MKTQIVYLVGNLLVEEDAGPVKMKPDLEAAFPKVEFREFDPTEDLPEDSEDLIIIDTVQGIKEPRVFTDIDDFQTVKPYSMHDFDLGWQLKLYKKLRMINKVTIIGIPMRYDKKSVIKKIKTVLI